MHGRPIGTHQRSFEWYYPRPPKASSSQAWGFATPPKTPIAIISGTGKDTDLKFGQNNNRVRPNKSPLAWAYPETAQLSRVPLLSQERVKVRTSNFARSIIKNLGESSRGRSQGLRDSRKFLTAPIHKAHRAVIYVIAQLSCIIYHQPCYTVQQSAILCWLRDRCYSCSTVWPRVAAFDDVSTTWVVQRLN